MSKASAKGNWDKVQLYIVSLWLLFLLIIIITIDVPVCFAPDCEFIGVAEFMRLNVIPIVSAALLLLGLIFYWRFRHKIAGSKEIPFTVTELKNINFEHLTFLTTYIIPLICFDLSSTRYAFVLLVLLVLIGAIYVKTDMFYANPTLALLGYHIYKVDGNFRTGVRENIILIARERIAVEDKLHYRKLDERIYYVKVAHDKI
ncbi:MAG: anti-phage protein KwaA [Candidatus Zixiibacteriota bacterium]